MEQSNRKLEVKQSPDEDETCKTFILKDEDHTLGNALRYIISKNPDVEVCGYSVSHPSVRDINLRIQTKPGVSATDIFKKGLEDLHQLCNHMKKTFQAAMKEQEKERKEKKYPNIDGTSTEMDI